MFEDDSNLKSNDNREQKKPPGGFKISSLTWVAWIAIMAALMSVFYVNSKWKTQAMPLSEYEFFQKFRATNQIVEATISMNPQMPDMADIQGTYYKDDKDGNVVEPKVEIPYLVANALLTPTMKDELLLSGDKSKNVRISQPNSLLLSIGYQLLFFVGIGVLFWFFFIRQIKLAGKGALSFGKSKARMLAKERNKTTFKDVAGIEEAIEEVSELVEFLKDPKKFQRLGGRIPKGVLMVGPPGTG